MTSLLNTRPSDNSLSQAQTNQRVIARWWAAINRFLNTLGGLARLAMWRIRYYSGLSLLALIGVIIAVGLVTSAAFFAQAVDQVMLNRELAEYSRITQRPPFAARVFSPSTQSVPLTLERTFTLGEHVAETLSSEVGLPVSRVIMLADSGNLGLLPPPDDSRYASSGALADTALVHMTGVGDEIEIIDGAAYDEEAQSGEALDVWMHTALAAQIGAQIDDRFIVPGSEGAIIPVRVAGIWSPADPKSPFWLNDPNQTMVAKLFVRAEDYQARVEPALNVKVRTVTWQVILDESRARPAQARNYKNGFEKAGIIIPRYLPDARLTAPTLSLEKFVGQQTALTTLLLGFNVPALGFLLYFLVLTSAVIAYWQRRETSLLRSRGITRISILNFTLIEALVLFVVGVPLGLLLGLTLARMMGYTESFLSFVERPPLPVSVNGINLPLTLITLGVVLVAKLWTVNSSSDQTIVTQTREQARPTRGPFWYRNYLDLLLIIPTFYAYQQFLQRGSLAALVQDRPEDLYQDPLLILVPGIFIITLALIAMRFFPLLMRLLDLLANRMRWFPSYLALRQLGRQSHAYINPLLLVIVSLALGVYTLSMAASMDHWLVDRIYYRVGTDMTFRPFLESEAQGGATAAGADWIPPVDEFTVLPGVEHAARVGDYQAEFFFAGGSGRTQGRFMAIDRLDFPLTAWFRSDFAQESLGGLMNRLALVPDGILISRQLLEANSLRIGDRVSMLVIPDLGVSVRQEFTVVGIYEYFPTAYPEQPVAVGNLEYINSFFGVTMPHRIWLRLKPGVTVEQVKPQVESTGILASNIESTAASLNSAQAEMQRVGVFGTLTVSFLAAALMAALGLLTYSYASLHERLFQFSVLRAVGLRRGEIITQVALEYSVLTAYGALAGVLCGSLAARLFVPLFRFTGGTSAALPPLVPIIAQERIIPLAVSFAVIMVIMELLVISSAFYRRLFESLRMGHQG